MPDCFNRSVIIFIKVLCFEAPRIIGGGLSNDGAWPWQVKITRSRSYYSVAECGGTIIDRYWILTSASCVEPAGL